MREFSTTCSKSKNCWTDSGFSSRQKLCASSRRWCRTTNGPKITKKKSNFCSWYVLPSSNCSGKTHWFWLKVCSGSAVCRWRTISWRITLMSMSALVSRRKTCLPISDSLYSWLNIEKSSKKRFFSLAVHTAVQIEAENKTKSEMVWALLRLWKGFLFYLKVLSGGAYIK